MPKRGEKSASQKNGGHKKGFLNSLYTCVDLCLNAPKVNTNRIFILLYVLQARYGYQKCVGAVKTLRINFGNESHIYVAYKTKNQLSQDKGKFKIFLYELRFRDMHLWFE